MWQYDVSSGGGPGPRGSITPHLTPGLHQEPHTACFLPHIIHGGATHVQAACLPGSALGLCPPVSPSDVCVCRGDGYQFTPFSFAHDEDEQ